MNAATSEDRDLSLLLSLEGADRVPPASALAARAVVSGLRLPGSETQLTRLIAHVLLAEQHLARSFLRIVFAASPGAATVDLEDVPADLYCVAEESSSHGRFDLSFRSASAPWRAVVELKIHAGYGPNQLDRYLQALSEAPTGQGFLVAITRSVPLHGDLPLSAARPGWLGSVRWGRLLPELRKLPIRDLTLRGQWLVALDVLEEEGAMGFTNPEPALFVAWRETNRAIAHLRTLVDAYRESVRDGLNEHLGLTPSTGGARFKRTSDGEITVAVRSGLVVCRLLLGSQQTDAVRFGIGAWSRVYACVDLLGYPRPTALGSAPPEARERAQRILALPEFGPHSPSHNFLRAAYHLDGVDRERLLVDDLPAELARWSLSALRGADGAGAFAHLL